MAQAHYTSEVFYMPFIPYYATSTNMAFTNVASTNMVSTNIASTNMVSTNVVSTYMIFGLWI